MEEGIAIGDVQNKLEELTDNVVFPVSSGENEPEVVEFCVLKDNVAQSLSNEEIDIIINNSNLATT